MTSSSWDIEQDSSWDRVRQAECFVILGHFLKKSKFWKNMKKCLEILSFYTYMCSINEGHMKYGSWNIRWDRQKFLSFWAIFCPFSPLTTQKIKILKLKKTPGNIIILHVCTINHNYMIWFLRYGVRQTEFFVILDHFLPFHPTIDPKNQNFEKWKKRLKILSFYKCASYVTVIWCMVPGIWSATDKTFCHFGQFFALLSP